MGAYLDKPVTEKVTEEGGNARLSFAATTMQGWRVNQEDAHNCIADFAENCALFSVYDGHGGSEVAQYAADHFPQFLLNKDAFKKTDFARALEEAFIEFDDHLRSQDVLSKLKAMANKENGVDEDDEDEDEDDRKELLEEQKMPLELLLKKYGCMLVRNGVANPSLVSAIVDAANGRSEDGEDGKEKKKRPHSPEGEQPKRRKPCSGGPPRKMRRADAVAEEESTPVEAKKEDGDKSKDVKEEKKESEDEPPISLPEPGPASTEEVNNGQTTNGNVEASAVAPGGGNVASSDSESGDDADYVAGAESEEEEDEEEDEEDSVEDKEEAETAVGEEADEEEEEESSDDDLTSGAMVGGPGVETPGEDSGTTACLALVFPDRIIVANVGDSRAVLSRAGTAVDLSVDHKPEDEEEKRRIEKAGGEISEDGRVNGGLNLSRALGDHCYKKTPGLPLAEQMISALPDVREEPLVPEDEFLVLACDGIWNSLTSQQVVDFVKERFKQGLAITEICEQLCHECLAENTDGDGSGCDNETVIIVNLKKKITEEV